MFPASLRTAAKKGLRAVFLVTGLAYAATACDDQPAPASIQPPDAIVSAQQRAEHQALLTHAIEVALERMSAMLDFVPTRIVLEAPPAFADPHRPRELPGAHDLSAALVRLAEKTDGIPWREGTRDAELTCEPLGKTLPPILPMPCTMHPETIMVSLPIVERLGERRYRVVVVTERPLILRRTQRRSVSHESHHMTLSVVDGEWSVIEYGFGQA